MNRLRTVWEDLRSSLWFIPTLLVTAAVALALGLIELEGPDNRWRLAQRWPRLFGAGADGARELLSAIAGSMITVAGVTFSILIVALTLASSQYTSRILRNFMRNRAQQTVLGVFVSVFVYCLVVLRTISSSDEATFVPRLAVVMALLLAFVAIGCLIFFIHHIAASLQATSILASVANETLEAIDRLYPAEIEREREGRETPAAAPSLSSRTLPARKTGYLQSFDDEALLELARTQNAVLKLEPAVGDFVIDGCPLASVSGAAADDALVQALNDACVVGPYRTVTQDVGYGIRQIVDVALKALSPGINDTTTAINAVDYLGAILVRLAPRPIEAPVRFDGARLRVMRPGPTFESLLADAFDQIRQNAEGNVAVLAHLHRLLATIAARTDDPRRLAALRQQADLVAETSTRSVPSAHDRATIAAARKIN